MMDFDKVLDSATLYGRPMHIFQAKQRYLFSFRWALQLDNLNGFERHDKLFLKWLTHSIMKSYFYGLAFGSTSINVCHEFRLMVNTGLTGLNTLPRPKNLELVRYWGRCRPNKEPFLSVACLISLGWCSKDPMHVQVIQNCAKSWIQSSS